MDAGKPIVFLNGQFLPRSEAKLDIEDRGALFADGVYEVIHYYNGQPLAMPEHLARLRRSMDAIGLPQTDEIARIESISAELVKRNRLKEAKVYWQITRGAAPREHGFPKGVRPTVMLIASPSEGVHTGQGPREVSAILAADERWHHCDIKSLMLLPNVLARNRAFAVGAYEAILHRAGTVTEGTATSVLMIRRGEIWTHPADQWILGGITRGILLKLARSAGIVAYERTFTTAELLAADEVMICGSTTHIAAITRIDERVIGSGKAGPVTEELNRLFTEHVLHVCPDPAWSAGVGARSS